MEKIDTKSKKLITAFLGGMVIPCIYAWSQSTSIPDFLVIVFIYTWFVGVAVGITSLELEI